MKLNLKGKLILLAVSSLVTAVTVQAAVADPECMIRPWLSKCIVF